MGRPRASNANMTGPGLHHLLTLLSPDPERAAELYLHLQSKLIRFFRWNQCPNPEDLADETMDRVARRASEGESIERPVSYIFGVARRVLLERKPSGLLVPISEEDTPATPTTHDEQQLSNLDTCLNELPPESRALLLEYYSADAAARIRVRQDMADRLGLSLNALRNRCLRLRQSLEECMRRQLEERK